MILRGSVASKILEMETGITVIVPDGERGARPKVAYLLHGLFGNHGNWTDFTLLPVYARDLNVVFVMPEAGRSFYADMANGQRFFSYVADELPAVCARTFNIAADRADTAVIGGSMGGYGALKCALARPERFGFCGALASACLFLGRQVEGTKRLDARVITETLGEQLVRDFRGILGEGLEPRPEDEVLELARRAAAGGVMPRIYSCCGLDDDLRGENVAFAAEMNSLGFDFTYEEWAGGHDWFFFDAALKRCLDYAYGD